MAVVHARSSSTDSSNSIGMCRQWPITRLVSLHAIVSKCLQRRVRGFGTDVAFLWAEKNPNEARACLKVPPPPTSLSSSPSSLEEYYANRKWDFSSVQHNESEYKWAQRLVSGALSAPLTVSQHFPWEEPNKQQRLAVVGARAEATLPVEYWKEMLISNSSTRTSKSRDNGKEPLCWTLDFVGPRVLSTSDKVVLKHRADALTLQWTHSGYLHEMPEPIPQWDGFVLLNPGVGHDRLCEGWLPTLEYLRGTQKPILLTALSQPDADRDASLLEKVFGTRVDYRRNEFASRITYEDPQSGHRVSPNSLVALVTF